MYKHLPLSALPATESLKDTYERVLPYWIDTIAPSVMKGENVLVVAHGNSLRAIVKYLAKLDDAEIMGFSIPTACPLVFNFDENMNAISIEEKPIKPKSNYDVPGLYFYYNELVYNKNDHH